MMKKFLIIFFISASFIFSQYSSTSSLKEDIFFDFEEDVQIWKITPIKNNCIKDITLSNEKFISGKRSLMIKIDGSGEGSAEKEFFKDLSIYKNIIFNIYIPANAPDDI